MKPNLDQVLEILKKEGLSDDAIKGFVETITKSLSMEMYTSMIYVLSDEEMDLIEKLPNDEAREEKLVEVFKQKTGTDPQVLADQYVKTFTESFLENYRTQQAQA